MPLPCAARSSRTWDRVPVHQRRDDRHHQCLMGGSIECPKVPWSSFLRHFVDSGGGAEPERIGGATMRCMVSESMWSPRFGRLQFVARAGPEHLYKLPRRAWMNARARNRDWPDCVRVRHPSAIGMSQK
jgi:hypothetical protein